jgi:hypothetical protein
MDDSKLIPVWLTGDQVFDSVRLADALAKTGALLNVDSSLMVIGEDGALRLVGRTVLQELAARHLIGKRIVNRGTKGSQNYVIEQVPVELAEQVVRNMLHGLDVRKNDPLPGGSLADRVPSVFSVLAPALPAQAAG